MNAHLLVDAVVQQTMVFIAQLATTGGVRAPLAHVAQQVFLDLTNELQNRGVKKKVIADMFGMALRTYHRRVRELGESRTDTGKSVWEAVLSFVREREPVSGFEVLDHFGGDDPEVVGGVLGDLTHSGLVYRAGRGDGARYRIANAADFASDDGARAKAHQHLAWLAVYRVGPATAVQVGEWTRLSEEDCRSALDAAVRDGQVTETKDGDVMLYRADRFEVPIAAPSGWEAAVLDHFQAMVTAIVMKLDRGRARGNGDYVGGSTWSLDVATGHPLEMEAKELLSRIRIMVEDLRLRIDAYNAKQPPPSKRERVVFYAGQYVTESAE